MNTYCIAILYAAILAGFSSMSLADSLRCKTTLIQIGDTEAEILDQCGDPIATDNFCEPIAVSTPPSGVQIGNNNVQNNVSIATCENIDIWTYNPGKGKFTTHLYFARGQLQRIRYGDRVK